MVAILFNFVPMRLQLLLKCHSNRLNVKMWICVQFTVPSRGKTDKSNFQREFSLLPQKNLKTAFNIHLWLRSAANIGTEKKRFPRYTQSAQSVWFWRIANDVLRLLSCKMWLNQVNKFLFFVVFLSSKQKQKPKYFNVLLGEQNILQS